MKPVITIYGRPGCHLCDEAEARVRDLAGDAVDVGVVNIEADDDLHKRLLELIPVIELDGVRVSELAQFRRRPFDEVIGSAIGH